MLALSSLHPRLAARSPVGARADRLPDTFRTTHDVRGNCDANSLANLRQQSGFRNSPRSKISKGIERFDLIWKQGEGVGDSGVSGNGD